MVRVPLIIVGAGSIGQRHMGVAASHPDVDLVAVVEPNADLRATLTQAGWPMVASLDDAPQAQAAIIATPTGDHAATAKTCLGQGLAVLVEKPIAHSIAAATDLIATADRAGLPLFVGHHRRCHPLSIEARARLHTLGDIVGVQGLWSLRKHDTYFDAPWRTRAGAGPLMTNFSHEVDLLRFLMGDITYVSALTSRAARRLDVEDTATLAFEFASGALGSFLMSDAGLSPWAFETGTGENPAIATSDEDYLRFTGPKGALAFPSLTTWGTDTGPRDWTTRLTPNAAPPLRDVDPLMEQLSRFITLAQGGEDSVLCTGHDGLRALEITIAARVAARDGMVIKTDEVPPNFDGY